MYLLQAGLIVLQMLVILLLLLRGMLQIRCEPYVFHCILSIISSLPQFIGTEGLVIVVVFSIF
jgi:hypothetical protein